MSAASLMAAAMDFPAAGSAAQGGLAAAGPTAALQMPQPPAASSAAAVAAQASPAHSGASSRGTAATPTEFLQRWQHGQEGGDSLSPEEEEATHAFLAVVNPWRATRGYEQLGWNSAVKFLMARKFHVERALVLYQQHELMRIREGLRFFDPDESPLQEELSAGKFTILPGRDANGATLALFHAHRHDPSRTSHRTTLQGVVYQLDVALESAATQRGGLVFIYNMSGSKYANFDYDLSQKMLTLLKGAYPARLKKVLIVTAPLWFKAPFKVLRLFVREKLRDRVFTVSIPQLLLHVDPKELPEELGGSLKEDHGAWLDHCQEVAKRKDGELITMSSSQPTSPAEHKRRQPTLEQLETLPVKAGAVGGPPSAASKSNGLARLVIPQDPPPAPPPEDEDQLRVANGIGNGHEDAEVAARVENVTISPHSSDDDETGPFASETAGMTLPEFIEHVKVKGRRGLYEEYTEIKNRPPSGTFHHSRAFENQVKNRYTDVLCYDHSRVVLSECDDGGDYINANFVDGYKQSRAFISSQGPLPRTFCDFWQMVWEQRVLVVVMTTKAVERHRAKCGQYWPEDVGDSLVAGPFEVTSGEIENCDDFVVTHLVLRDSRTETERRVCHFQFVSWPDYGVPDSALSMLHFLQRVREKQAEMVKTELVRERPWTGHELGPPIVVHCSAGIGRTGTFATLDIAIRKFEDVGRVDMQATVERIRAQRAFSIQMPDQYVFCHLAFLEYVLNMEYVEEVDLAGFDDDDDEYDT